MRSHSLLQRCTWILAGVTAVAAIALTLQVQAGFDLGADTDAGRYRKAPLTGSTDTPPTGQYKAVQDAIEFIEYLAGNDPSAYNRRLLARSAACLTKMLKEGRICQETANGGIKGVNLSERDRKCTWTGDRMNFAPGCLKSASEDEGAFITLVAVLVHESIHALQWPDGSGAADTSAQREWHAYSWEYYILCRILNEEPVSKAAAAKAQKRKDFVKTQRDTFCNAAITAAERARKLGAKKSSGARSKSDDSLRYEREIGDSTRIVVADEAGPLYEIQTPFLETYDIEVGLGKGDALFVCGTMGDTGGGVALYTDIDGDGLADEPSMQMIGLLPDPIALDFANDLLFVLDLETASLFHGPGAAFGQQLIPFPFATPEQFPFLTDMFDVRCGFGPQDGQVSAIVSPYGEAYDDLGPDRVEHELIDVNFDGQADVAQQLGWAEMVFNYAPTFIRDLQQGDTSVTVAAQGGSTVFVHESDANASALGAVIGVATIDPQDHGRDVVVQLDRPLFAGEHILVVDPGTNPQHETAGALVMPTRPEIFGTDLATYFPGDPLQIFGRNFGPAPIVTLSGQPLELELITQSLIIAQTPNVLNTPSNTFVLEVESGGGAASGGGLVSDIVGVQIVMDCNGNGIDDLVEISEGSLSDADGNGIADECEVGGEPCPADLNGDGEVSVEDMVTVILAWGVCGDPDGCEADINGDGFVDVQDLVAVVLAWGDCG